MTIKQWVPLLTAIVVSLGLIEALVLSWRRPGSYDWKGHHASVATLVLRHAMDWVPLWFILPGGVWLYEHRLFDIPLNTAWGLLALFMAQEFFYYWFHRAGHRIRWFWANHVVHHSPNQLTLSAAYRLGLTGKVTGALVWFVPMCWIGFAPQMVMLSFLVNLLFQFWIHAAWIPKLGWLEGVINTPSAHRVHHAANVEYLDANYGGVLMIFDRLFGTYVPERDEVKPRYGLVRPVTTNNPLKICFLEYGQLWRDLKGARNLREVAGYLFGPPGWAPDGQGLTTEALRLQAGLGVQEPASGGLPASGPRVAEVAQSVGAEGVTPAR